MTKTTSKIESFLNIIIPTLQLQIAPALGYGFCVLISLFYLILNNPKYIAERPMVLVFGLATSLFCVWLGNFLSTKFSEFKNTSKSLSRGAFIVVFTWMLACTLSAVTFVLAGFPDPHNVENFSFFRKFVDGFYESMSGFTTTGSSILNNVEAFPRGLLMWRSVTHLLGGMGIAYIGLTILQQIFGKREEIINGEAETHIILDYKNEAEARESGFDFIKIYLLLTGLLVLFLAVSGAFFRITPYTVWHDNIYDSVYYSFSTMGTGGFAPYNSSAGLMVTDTVTGKSFIGGLQNPVSEWIIAVFMIIAGSNLAILFDIFYKKNWTVAKQNLELKIYLAIVGVLSIGIGITLWLAKVGYSVEESFRYAFFNVATVISTTGLGNVDFALWPALAQALLFVVYLTGGMVGSTAGGLKVIRFIVGFKYIVQELKNLLYGTNKDRFEVDGVQYNRHNSALIVSTIFLYFVAFFGGLILIMATSQQVSFADGTVKNIDFVSALSVSIANLGNIGPAVAIGTVNAGPTGNYYAFSEISKIVMIFLMFIGRIGILSFMLLFITKEGERHLSINEEHFDSDLPHLLK